MFCIFHQACRSQVGDNGNCSVYPNSRVTRVNTQTSECCFLKPWVYAFGKPDVAKKRNRNPLKQSKKGG